MGKSNAWAPCMLHFNNKFYYNFYGRREDGYIKDVEPTN